MSRQWGMRLLALLPVAAIAAACGGQAGSAGEDYPDKEITWIVPYEAGGNTDSISRTVAKAMSDELGQDIVVENEPGGSGAIGMNDVQSSKPDGYTIGMFTTGTMVVTPLVNDLDYGWESFTNVGLMLTQPVVIMTTPDSNYSSMEELTEAAKRKPDDISIAVPGATTPQAFELTRMSSDYDVDFSSVPFNSNAEAITALRGGNVEAVALNASKDVREQLDAGDLEPLAVGEEERLSWLKETPTLKEEGFEDLTDSGTLIGLTAPADLAESVRSKLEDALEAALQEESVIDLLGEGNIPDDFTGTNALNDLLKTQVDVYKDLADKG